MGNQRPWFDHARHKFAMFNARERAAIAGYLRYKRDTDALTDLEKSRIDEAIDSYWANDAA